LLHLLLLVGADGCLIRLLTTSHSGGELFQGAFQCTSHVAGSAVMSQFVKAFRELSYAYSFIAECVSAQR
jgi:hypothetical protein